MSEALVDRRARRSLGRSTSFVMALALATALLVPAPADARERSNGESMVVGKSLSLAAAADGDAGSGTPGDSAVQEDAEPSFSDRRDNTGAAPIHRGGGETTGLWVVQLDEPSVARYEGGTAGLPATSPEARGTGRLDVDSSEVRAYERHLLDRQDAFLDEAATELERSLEAVFSYTLVLNAVALEISDEEAERLAALDGVAAIFEDDLREPETDASNDLIGAIDVWEGTAAPDLATKGEGVVVAMIDSGVNPNHPSFLDTTDDHDYPTPEGGYVGVCDPDTSGQPHEDICNDKLIGAWLFPTIPASGTARDNGGHGSHVGSTIAGAAHTASLELGGTTHDLDVSGVAPHAQVISYKVCESQCPPTSTVAAVQQAIIDGVDVINYSISGIDNPWGDIVDLTFLEAFAAGMVVSASAGNDGPGTSTVAKTGPWNFAVAATTSGRLIAHSVSVTGHDDLTDMPAVPAEQLGFTQDGTWPAASARLVTPNNASACSAIPAGTFDGEVVVVPQGTCADSAKLRNIAAGGGAGALIVLTDAVGAPITSVHSSGAVADLDGAAMLSNSDGRAIEALLNAGEEVELSITGATERILGDRADQVAGFSSRGPGRFDTLSPTFAAPGREVLAAYSSPDQPADAYRFAQGTSMASPHAAGAAALLTALRDDLTPAEIRSALSMTAVTDGLFTAETGRPANWFDAGAGRIDVEAASRVGLVMNETAAQFNAANPLVGGDPRTLNLPALIDSDCVETCTFTRTVRNAADAEVTYTVAADGSLTASDIEVHVDGTPVDAITLGSQETQEIEVTVDVTSLPLDSRAFGNLLVTTDGTHANGADIADGHLPVVVIPTMELPSVRVAPNEVASQHLEGVDTTTETFAVHNIGDIDLDWQIGSGGEGNVWLQPRTSTQAMVSDYFIAEGTGVYSADDFKVVNDSVIESIFTPGYYVQRSLLTAAEAVTWMIYPDDDGKPAGHPEEDESDAQHVWAFSTDIDDPAVTIGVSGNDESITLDITAADIDPPTLETGTYWLTVFPSITEGANLNDRWAWDRGIQRGAQAHLNSPGGLIAPTDGWESFQDIGENWDSLAMTLGGQVGCELPEDLGWLSVDPNGGTVAPNGDQSVDVVFDSSTLDDGLHETILCIESNDLRDPHLVVPVSLFVGNLPPQVETAPETVEVRAFTGATAWEDLVITNAGDDDLIWQFAEADEPWLSVDPAAGTTERHESDTVRVIVDATDLDAGSYDVALELTSNDPTNPSVEVPVSVTVDEPDVVGDFVEIWNGDTILVTTQWGERTVDLAPWAGETACLAFVYRANDGHEWVIDDIEVASGDDTHFAENFDSDETFPPTGWDTYNVGDLPIWDWARITNNPNSPPAAVYHGWAQSGADVDDWLVTPTFELGDEPVLNWFERYNFIGSYRYNGIFLSTGDCELDEPERHPEISIDPESVEVTLEEGEDTVEEIVIANTGDATLTWGASISGPDMCGPPLSAPWLTFDPPGGGIEPGDDQVLTLTIDAADLDGGVYEAQVCLATNDPDNSFPGIPVTLTVTEVPAQIVVDVDAIGVTVDEGMTSTATFEITNAGTSDLDWTIGTTAVGDGRAGLVDVTHSASQAITPNQSSGCPNNPLGFTRANQFLRVFDLAEDFDIAEDFEVLGVTFGVQMLTRDATIDVNLYTLDGELLYDNLTLIGTAAVDLTPQEETLVEVPVEGIVEAGSVLVAEIAAPALDDPIGQFMPGSNAAGQTAPSYVASSDSDCPAGWSEPRPTGGPPVGPPRPMHLVMSVTGVEGPTGCGDPTDAGWLTVDPASGTTPGGQTSAVEVTVDAADLVPGTHDALLCIRSNGGLRLDLPVTATVSPADDGDGDGDGDAGDDDAGDDDAGDDDAGDDDAGDDDAGDDDAGDDDAGDDDAGDDDAGDDDAGDDDAGEPLPEGMVRVSGENRFETAVEVSRASFGDGEAGSVVLARADDFADSLAGTALAVDRDAPVLLTVTDTLVDVVADEIERVLPTGGTVYILGGTAALDASVEADLVALGYTPARLAGPERIGTSLAVATELGDTSDVLITDGFNFPDALAAGAAAAEVDGVVVLTTPDAADPQIDAFLTANPDATVTAVGGPAARAYPDAIPVFGATREATAVAVAEAFFAEPGAVAIARQDEFADALAGGAHIGRLGGPLLLTPDVVLHPDTQAYVCANAESVTTGFVYGGTAAVSDDVLDRIAEHLDGACSSPHPSGSLSTFRP